MGLGWAVAGEGGVSAPLKVSAIHAPNDAAKRGAISPAAEDAHTARVDHPLGAEDRHAAEGGHLASLELAFSPLHSRGLMPQVRSRAAPRLTSDCSAAA